MSTKHTPGPWRVGDNGATIFGPKTESSNLRTVATLTKLPMVIQETKANARLIAAAPELLEALEKLLKWHQYAREHGAFTMAGGDIYIDPGLARKAIAKATGGAE